MSLHDPSPTDPHAIAACGTASVHSDDLAKVEIFAFLVQLAEIGHATLSPLTSGEIEVKFASGEVFLLGDYEITRLPDRPLAREISAI